jgi:ParB-like chromosome segregation protein Spo0J
LAKQPTVSVSPREPQGLAIRRVSLASLHNDPANARSHDEQNLAAIKASLQRFGQAEPLVVHKATGRVIGGNGRLVAMRTLGWTEVDVVELDLDDLQATALGIALNRTAELAAWDEPALVELLKRLQEDDELAGTGFDDADIRDLLAGLEGLEPKDVDDQGPEPPSANAISRTGDLWLLGDHRLLAGDSTNPVDITRLLAGDRAALLSTDPPYCVDYTGNDRPIHEGRSSGKDWSQVYREVDIKDLGVFLDGVFTACLPHVVPDAGIYVWHAHVQQPVIAATFEKHGLLLRPRRLQLRASLALHEAEGARAAGDRRVSRWALPKA